MKKPLLLCLASCTMVYSNQTTVSAPESPGIQMQKLDEIDKTVIPKKDKKAIIDNLKVGEDVKGKGENRVKTATFTLQNVSITGNSILDQKDIISIVKPYIGKGVDSLDLKTISEKITQLYTSKGYVTSKCIIPAQKVENGNVKFQIIEDKLGKIKLTGTTTYNYDSNIFMRYLNHLQGKVINAQELNRQLQLLSNLPVIRIKPRLEKTNLGYTNLVLEIIEGKESFSLSTDNGGSAYTGEERLTLNGNINNIRGKSDSLQLSLTTVSDTEKLSSLSMYYLHPVGKEGAKIGFSYSKMSYLMIVEGEDAKDAFAGSNFTDVSLYYAGNSESYGFSYIKPTYFDKYNLSYDFGITNKQTITEKVIATYYAQNKNNKDSIGDEKEDENFVINMGVTVSKLDSLFSSKYNGVSKVGLSLKKGLEGLLGTSKKQDISIYDKNNIKENSDMSFTKLNYILSRQQQLPWDTITTVKFSGDYTKDRVPDSYEYSGADYGYAYSLSFAKKFMIEQIPLNTTVSLSQSKVFTYDTNMNKTDEENSPSASLKLNSKYEDFDMTLSYSSSFDTWDSNTNSLRYNIKYTW